MSELTPTTSSRAALLNEDEDALSDRFEQVLEEVFRRYAVKNGGGEPTPEDNVDQLSLRKKELDAFSEATNGAAMTQETYDEICEYFTLVDDRAEGDERGLTFRGFYELYAMQTPNDEDESWKDINAWGYDEQLSKLDTSVPSATPTTAQD